MTAECHSERSITKLGISKKILIILILLNLENENFGTHNYFVYIITNKIKQFFTLELLTISRIDYPFTIIHFLFRKHLLQNINVSI